MYHVKRIIFLVGLFILIFSMRTLKGEESPEVTAPHRIGHANFLIVFHSYYRTREEDKRLREREGELQRKIDVEREKIIELEKRLSSGILTDEMRKKLEEEIGEKRRGIEEKVRKFNLEMEAERRKIITQLIEELRGKIAQFGRERGYMVIFDSKDLLYAEASLEVTKEIVEYINEPTPEVR